MKKSDLKSGMWIELRDGRKYLIITHSDTLLYGKNIVTGINSNGFISLSDKEYDDSLSYMSCKDYDIIKVYYSGKVNDNTYSAMDIPLYWERKEEPTHTELSISEIEEKLQLQSGTLRIKKEPNG